jgi:hypothetical protein
VASQKQLVGLQTPLLGLSNVENEGKGSVVEMGMGMGIVVRGKRYSDAVSWALCLRASLLRIQVLR